VDQLVPGFRVDGARVNRLAEQRLQKDDVFNGGELEFERMSRGLSETSVVDVQRDDYGLVVCNNSSAWQLRRTCRFELAA
jgi:hypothetical protein